MLWLAAVSTVKASIFMAAYTPRVIRTRSPSRNAPTVTVVPGDASNGANTGLSAVGVVPSVVQCIVAPGTVQVAKTVVGPARICSPDGESESPTTAPPISGPA